MFFIQPGIEKTVKDIYSDVISLNKPSCSMSVRDIIYICEKRLSNLDNCFVGTRENHRKKDVFLISGCYDSTNNNILLEMCCSRATDICSSSSKELAEKIALTVGKVLNHEHIHRLQYIARGKTNSSYNKKHGFNLTENNTNYKNELYLSNPDEIEAYAHDAINEKLFLIPKRFIHESNWHVNIYKEVFHYDEKHPTLKKFFDNVRYWERHYNVKVL